MKVYHIYLLNCRGTLPLEKTLHLSCTFPSRRQYILCLTKTWWVETFSDNIFLTAACAIMARAECPNNQHGGVAI